MSFHHLMYPRDGCVECNENPQCNCAAGDQCILTSRTCSQCPQIQCIKGSSSSGGINPGVIAGPVVAVMVIASLALFWYLRRKKRRDLQHLEQLADRARKAESVGFALSHPGSPAVGAGSLNRSTSSRSRRAPSSARLPAPASGSRRSSPLPPASVNAEYLDDNGDRVRVYGPNGTINLDPKHPDNGGDPFSDRQSVSTMATSTHSTNIIPIQYIPSSRSEDGMSTAQAARKLDEARQNLFRPGAPARPARSGDSTYRDPRSPESYSSVPRIRDSYVSDNSAVPSFWSGGSYDVHNDAPKIVTSRQVHVGKIQHAEVVHMGKGRSPPQAPDTDEQEWDRTPTPATFGGRLRSTSPGYTTEEGFRGDGESAREPQSAGPNDLRFSMDSLAYRDSMSSMGTFRYLAQSDPSAIPGGPTPRPLGPSTLRSPSKGPPAHGAARDSTFSNKSYADSVLAGFPMITPPQTGNLPPLPTGVPQSSSSNTLDGHGQIPRPPGSFRPLPQTTAQAASQTGPGARPLTTASVADSLLGSFPFVPPNMDDLAELPSAALPTGVAPDTAKRG